ncbi:hypothetical protein V2J09_015554 [Rumex salicifolius]
MASAGFLKGGGRFKELVRKYGKVALGIHFTISAASFTGLYVAIKNNVDVESMLEKIGVGATTQPQIEQSHSQEQQPPINGGGGDSVSSGDRIQVDGSADQQVQKQRNRTAEMVASSGGALALAILCNKALFPVRLPITFALTPPIARFLRSRNIIKNAV